MEKLLKIVYNSNIKIRKKEEEEKWILNKNSKETKE